MMMMMNETDYFLKMDSNQNFDLKKMIKLNCDSKKQWSMLKNENLDSMIANFDLVLQEKNLDLYFDLMTMWVAMSFGKIVGLRITRYEHARHGI